MRTAWISARRATPSRRTVPAVPSPRRRLPRRPRAAAGARASGSGRPGHAASGRGRGASGRRVARRLPPADDNDDSEVVVAGLVGGGGGGLTALVFAAREGDIESARKLLTPAKANVNQTTEYGWTPLLTAVNNRNYQLAQLLLEHGADVNLANKGGWTPLYLATDNRNIEGGDYPVPKPDLDHLDLIKAAAREGRQSEREGEGQHADAHDLHDAVVLRERRHALHPRRAVERHRR